MRGPRSLAHGAAIAARRVVPVPGPTACLLGGRLLRAKLICLMAPSSGRGARDASSGKYIQF
eukprot:485863-Pyramimonas_sp.AAC.1